MSEDEGGNWEPKAERREGKARARTKAERWPMHGGSLRNWQRGLTLSRTAIERLAARPKRPKRG